MEPSDIVYLPNRKLHETMISIEDIDHHEGLLFMNASLMHVHQRGVHEQQSFMVVYIFNADHGFVQFAVGQIHYVARLHERDG